MALSNEVCDAISGAVFSLECLRGVFLMCSDMGELETMVLGKNVGKKGTSFGVITREGEGSGGGICVMIYCAIETGNNSFLASV